MSLLASEGIGVFNRVHFVIKGRFELEASTNVPTHEYVWEAMKEWSKTGAATALLSRVLFFDRQPLDKIIGTAFPGSTLSPLAAEWFTSWGLDLSAFDQERILRNTSSYRPALLQNTEPRVSASAAIANIISFWKTFEPDTSGGFPSLDRELVRLAFEQVGRALKVSRSSTLFQEAAQRVAADLGVAQRDQQLIREFLMRSTTAHSGELLLLDAARRRPTKAQSEFSMIARATLLLRMALASTKLLIQESGCDKRIVRDLISDQSSIDAQSDDDSEDSDYFGLWEGVQENLDLVESLTHEQLGFSEMTALAAHSVIVLSQCERLVIWALNN